MHRLKADIKRDARQKRKSPNTQPWGTSNPDSLLLHKVVTREKHAGDLQETHRTQSSPAIRFALLLLKLTESPFFFFLPCSKNSDLRFKFFKDMDSDSTWEKEIRTQWVMREQGNMLSSNNATWDKCSTSKMYNHVFLTSCYITQQMPLILLATVQWVQRWFKSTQRQSPVAVLLCTERRNGRQDQLHNLSGCVLRSLPLFLVVSGSSRQPPLTPFEATSCGEARHGERLFKRHSATRKGDKGWYSIIYYIFSVTYNDLVGGGLVERQRFFRAARGEIQAGVHRLCVGGT